MLNMKKIFIIGAVLIALCMFIGAASATPSILNPEGFTVNKDLGVQNQSGSVLGVPATFDAIVMENGTDNITVQVFYPSKDINLSPSGASEWKNISSKQGIFEKKGDRYIFAYVEEGELIQIDSPSESLIEQVIGK